VVKADAYRHGAVEVSRILEQQGAAWLAVSNVEEGVALRRAGAAARILVMADFLPFEIEALREHRLTPVIHSLEHIAQLDRLGTPIHYHLKLDSGMGRLGTLADPAEISAAITGATNATLEGLMTHFASAGDYSKPQTESQIRHFNAVAGRLAESGIYPKFQHLGSTIAVAYGRLDSWKNMVRVGHAIYGYVSPARGDAAPNQLLKVDPALTWKAAILSIKDVPAGTKIGYGGIFTAPEPMRIGIIAAGYADGVPHRLSNRGKLIAGGQFAPILGAVSMDLMTIDMAKAPQLKPGDAVTIIGAEGKAAQNAQQLAKDAGSISYSVLCGISARVHRLYVD
jgi:alanine racemase